MIRLKLIGIICRGIMLIKAAICKEYNLAILASIRLMYLGQN